LRGVPVVKAALGEVLAEGRFKQSGGGLVKCRAGVRWLCFQFFEAEADGVFDLGGEVEVVAGEVREKGVNEMEVEVAALFSWVGDSLVARRRGGDILLFHG